MIWKRGFYWNIYCFFYCVCLGQLLQWIDLAHNWPAFLYGFVL
jgi:hypothetical protein